MAFATVLVRAGVGQGLDPDRYAVVEPRLLANQFTTIGFRPVDRCLWDQCFVHAYGGRAVSAVKRQTLLHARAAIADPADGVSVATG